MVEWFKAHAWKACDMKVSGGSNPLLSANVFNIRTLKYVYFDDMFSIVFKK